MPQKMKEINLSEIDIFVKALHCPIRWDIIEILKNGPKSSKEIYDILKEKPTAENSNDPNCKGKCHDNIYPNLKKHSLYYHLRELEAVKIIALDEFKPSEEGRAPEKVWKLNMDKIVINLK